MPNKQTLYFVKIGGSLITDKSKPYTLRPEALKLIAQQVGKLINEGKKLILGHGHGSFAHIPAKKYQTHLGLMNENSLEGIAQVSQTVRKLNLRVMEELLKEGVPAVSFGAVSFMLGRQHRLESLYTDSIEQALRIGSLPVVFGDQLLDIESGCTIFSTEKVLGYIALELKRKGWNIAQIIHCGQTNGVYDRDGNTITEITENTIDYYRDTLTGSGSVDVTGGMLHKVEETLQLAKAGIPGLIIDGIDKGSLYDAVMGKPVLGTKVIVETN